MSTRILKIATLAGSVLLWFALPSFGQTKLASFPKHATAIGLSETWTANAISTITLIDNSSKSTGRDSLFADGHFRNSNDDRRNYNDNSRKHHDPPQNPHDPHKGWVSAAEGGAATNYLILAGIACCAAIFLKRKQWSGEI